MGTRAGFPTSLDVYTSFTTTERSAAIIDGPVDDDCRTRRVSSTSFHSGCVNRPSPSSVSFAVERSESVASAPLQGSRTRPLGRAYAPPLKYRGPSLAAMTIPSRVTPTPQTESAGTRFLTGDHFVARRRRSGLRTRGGPWRSMTIRPGDGRAYWTVVAPAHRRLDGHDATAVAKPNRRSKIDSGFALILRRGMAFRLQRLGRRGTPLRCPDQHRRQEPESMNPVAQAPGPTDRTTPAANCGLCHGAAA
jgi:hypothetical protein